ncbi:MAG: tRNA pseudouridine(55) synthase TruB [Deltaproteobacteria bacterium]|nr:tRNA pseudouridine(55) synthase TruB [Deltaproteobacteria bacterium]
MSILVIDKPSGPSSFAVCKRVRAILGEPRQKVGHGGTLDPFASGVLPICLGEATKVLPFLLDADKRYEATVRFGVETDTLDCTGQVVAEHPCGALAAETIESALVHFRGEIAQVPPMFSALKRGGRPLYAYARAGQVVDRPARKVSIHELSLVEFSAPERARLRVHCSKGTYIRQLAADLGRHLGVGAHLLELRRTASGPFEVGKSVTLEELRARVADGRPPPALSLLEALAHLPTVAVDEEQALVLERGQRMAWSAFGQGRGLVGPACAVVDGPAGPALVAIVTRGDDGNVRILRGFRRK